MQGQLALGSRELPSREWRASRPCGRVGGGGGVALPCTVGPGLVAGTVAWTRPASTAAAAAAAAATAAAAVARRGRRSRGAAAPRGPAAEGRVVGAGTRHGHRQAKWKGRGDAPTLGYLFAPSPFPRTCPRRPAVCGGSAASRGYGPYIASPLLWPARPLREPASAAAFLFATVTYVRGALAAPSACGTTGRPPHPPPAHPPPADAPPPPPSSHSLPVFGVSTVWLAPSRLQQIAEDTRTRGAAFLRCWPPRWTVSGAPPPQPPVRGPGVVDISLL